MSHPYKDGLRLLPDHMHGAVERYIDNGIPPGSFVRAVMENDLMGAFGRADAINLGAMLDWANFVYNHAPSICHGSPAAVAEWIASGGLVGIETAAAKEQSK